MHTKAPGTLRSWISAFFDIDPHDRKKLLYLATCLFFVVAAFSLLKPLKNAVFFGLVGRDLQPYAKWVTIAFTPLLMPLYSKLVDVMRRYQLLFVCTMTYAVACLFFAIVLSDPTYGLPNAEMSSNRLLGWAFYLLIDFFPIFIVSTFWAFSSSISSPESAKHNYGLIVAASKLSGIISPLIGLALVHQSGLGKVTSISASLLLTSVFLAIAALAILRLIKQVPGKYLHGYEAVYEIEKQREREHAPKTGIWQGFKLMLTEPYVFGIFGMVYSYEIISGIIDYQKDYMASVMYNNEVSAMFSFNLIYTACWQALGFFFAIFGTSSLLRHFDVYKCLMAVPLIIGVLLVSLMLFPSMLTILIVMVILRALNYGFNVPIREMLYIPTVKDVKFKSKAWTDSFGRTFSKGTGAAINASARASGEVSNLIAYGSSISLGVVVAWMAASYYVARRYTRTIRDGKVIGEETSS